MCCKSGTPLVYVRSQWTQCLHSGPPCEQDCCGTVPIKADRLGFTLPVVLLGIPTGRWRSTFVLVIFKICNIFVIYGSRKAAQMSPDSREFLLPESNFSISFVVHRRSYRINKKLWSIINHSWCWSDTVWDWWMFLKITKLWHKALTCAPTLVYCLIYIYSITLLKLRCGWNNLLTWVFSFPKSDIKLWTFIRTSEQTWKLP